MDRPGAGGDTVYGVFRDGIIVGGCGLHRRRGSDILEIGYWIHVDHVRLGYATELAAALTTAAFEVDGVDRVEIHHDKANVWSGAVPRSLGYTRRPEEPDEIRAPAEVGIDCCWSMHRRDWTAGGLEPRASSRSGVPYDAAMDDVWGAYADEWDDQEGTRAYADAAFDSLRSVLEEAGVELSGARVVDFGCGTGLLTEHLVGAGAEVVAVDTSPAMLAVLRAKADRRRWTTVTMTAELDDVPSDRDVIVCSSVCSFLEDYPATAAELSSLLRPGGVFIQWDWEKLEDDHGLTRGEIVDALHGAGLEGIAAETAFEIEADGQTMRPLVGRGYRPADTSG